MRRNDREDFLGSGTKMRDAAPVLLLLIVALFVFPPQVAFNGPLKSNGAPAMLLGMLACMLWFFRWLHPSVALPIARRMPVRLSLALFMVSSVTAYAAAQGRVLDDAEARGATRAAVATLVRVGVAVYVADGLYTRERLELVLRWLVYAAAFASLIGMAQFFVGFNYLGIFQLPGLSTLKNLAEDNRSGFVRAPGTSAHPIEFGVLLAALLPISLHFAIHETIFKLRRRMRICSGLILATVPLTVTRSAAAGIIIVFAFIIWDWTRNQKANALLLAIIGGAVFKVLVPGLLGTIRSLFESAGVDPSVTGRTDDYASVFKLVGERPIFGLGLGTFRPEYYFFLDNQWLLTLLEGGIVGALALAQLYVISAGCARGARLRSTSRDTRSLGQALAASIMVFALAGATFDEFTFYQASMTLFILIGCCGALWRIVSEGQLNTPTSDYGYSSHHNSRTSSVHPTSIPPGS